MLGLGLNFGSSQSGSSAARMSGPVSLLLDTYTEAAAAYSLRKLKSDYTGKVLQVRRASDHVEVDVGFDSNGLLSLDSPVTNVTEESTGITQGSSTNAAKLGEFCGEARRGGGDTSYATVDSMTEAAHIELVTWYDQSGNTNNAAQVAAAFQPRIYDRSSGLIVENGKPAVDFGGTSQLDFTTISKVDVDPFAVFTVAQDTPNNVLFVDSTDAYNDALFVFTTYGQMRHRFDQTTYLDSINSDSVHRIFSVIDDGTNQVNVFYNGTSIRSGGYNVTNKAINLNRIGGTGHQATNRYSGIMQEAIFYNSNQSDYRADIETNINTFYSIY
jgi:hypothetical protein